LLDLLIAENDAAAMPAAASRTRPARNLRGAFEPIRSISNDLRYSAWPDPVKHSRSLSGTAGSPACICIKISQIGALLGTQRTDLPIICDAAALTGETAAHTLISFDSERY